MLDMHRFLERFEGGTVALLARGSTDAVHRHATVVVAEAPDATHAPGRWSPRATRRRPAWRARRFAHASEAELARILDFYTVRWEYEPRTFPILWNLDGQVVESFSPDFYLPDLDLWLELTTLRQSLVRRKNRKLRRMRELYPMIRIKLLYARDFRALMLKYGRLDVAASLIGDRRPGHARAPRSPGRTHRPRTWHDRAPRASPRISIPVA